MEGHSEHAPWSNFFTDLAKAHQGYEARLEIIGSVFGHQEEAAWLPFTGVSYDPHHNQILVTVGGSSSRYPVPLTHTITEPMLLHVHRTPQGAVRSILVVAADTTATVVHLRRKCACGTACHRQCGAQNARFPLP